MKIFKKIVIIAIVLFFGSAIIVGVKDGLTKDTKSTTKETKQEVKKETKTEEKEKPQKEQNESLKNKKIDSNQLSAEGVTKQYFQSWKDKNYELMYKLSQPTWRKNNGEDTIKSWYDFKKLKSFKLESKEGSAESLRKINVKCKYSISNEKTEEKSIKVNVIKEDEKWWVNPTSTLDEK